VSSSKSTDLQALDQLTGGVFTAATSGDRSARLREWLQSQPALEVMNEVFLELSARDRGAAKALRERMDEVRRARQQETVAAEWAARAQTLLQTSRLNIADAMAWQRDAAKAGAPLSREPLAGLKTRLAERVRAIEDLQHQIMVQREAAVLLTQRIEVLSTRPLGEAQAAHEALAADVQQWQAQQQTLQNDPVWPSVDLKYPPQIEAASVQLRAVWEAFDAALQAARSAWDDAQAHLPPVPVWAEDIRRHRGQTTAAEPAAGDSATGAAAEASAPRAPRMDAAQRQALRQQATQAVLEVLEAVEKEVAEGHGKATAGAAASLRQVLKVHGRNLDTALDARVHAALTAAGELEGWQRWRADQIRLELVAKAEALMKVVPAEPAAPAAAKASVSAQEVPAATEVAATEAAPPESEEPAAPADQGTEVQPAIPAASAEAADVASQASSAPEAVPETASEAAPAQTQGQEAVANAPAPSADAAQAAATDGAPAEPGPAKPVKPAKAPKRSAPAVHKVPTLSGRKMQDALRELREAWKQTDQGGLPNHSLWRRFDAACNEAYTVVQAWLDEVRQSSAAQRAQRTALIDEVKAWTAAHAQDSDWRAQIRALHQFGERWRNAGHLSEKAYAEMQAQWKKVIREAGQRLEQAQKASIAQRQALIAEAQALAAQPMLRVDAVKALQQRWQQEAQAVPLDRRTEQKMWETFRAPIDEAFQRKGSERQQATQALSARDRAVLDASRALDAANAEGDAQKIRAAMAALDAALKAQAEPAPSASTAAPKAASPAPANAAPASAEAVEPSTTEAAADAGEGEASTAAGAEQAAGQTEAPAEATHAAPVKPAPRPVVAVRGDDRPGQKRTELPAAGGRRDGKGPGMGRGGDRAGERGRGDWGDRGPRRDDRGGPREDRGPRLSDAAFRAQREARERAEQALRKLAAQAHGETLTQLMQAWQARQPEQLPAAQALGRAVNATTRQAWAQALSAPAGTDAATALLRLEMAADAPTPAEHLSERRMLQLQLLTRRNDAGPRETWGRDVATVLASGYTEGQARRLQNVLRALLRS